MILTGNIETLRIGTKNKKEVPAMACKGKGSKSSKGGCKTKKGGGCKK